VVTYCFLNAIKSFKKIRPPFLGTLILQTPLTGLLNIARIYFNLCEAKFRIEGERERKKERESEREREKERERLLTTTIFEGEKGVPVWADSAVFVILF
jgi:hypothetical protein